MRPENGGAPESCWSVGALFFEGAGIPKNHEEAAKWFARALLSSACDEGLASACPTSVPIISMDTRSRATQLGDAQMCLLAATARHAPAGVPGVPALEQRMFATACKARIVQGCAMLMKP